MPDAILEKIKHQQIEKLPVVIVPLAQWREMEAIIEELLAEPAPPVGSP